MTARPAAKRGLLVVAFLLLLLAVFLVMLAVFPVLALRILGGLSIFYFGAIGILLAGLLFLVAVVMLILYFASTRDLDRRKAAWDERKAHISRAWLCHRCGAEWVPSEGQGA